MRYRANTPGPCRGDGSPSDDPTEFRGGPRRGPGRGAGHDHGRGRGPRTRRGDMKWALLSALSEGPGHGYELIQRIEERTGGRWRPSPGSVYPTLQMLDDGGLVRSDQLDDKRVYEITEAGQAELTTRTEAAGGQPWMRDTDDTSAHGSFRHALGRFVMAAKQVSTAGNPELVDQATEIMDEARRQLYRLLAEA